MSIRKFSTFCDVTRLLFGTLQGPRLYLPNACSYMLSRLAKGTPSRVSAFKFPSVPLVWDKIGSCWLCARQSAKTRKSTVFRCGSAYATKFRNFFTIAPILTSTFTVCREIAAIRRHYTFWFGLELPGLSRPTGLCIPYNRCAKFYQDRLRFGSTRAKNLFRELKAYAWLPIMSR